MYYGNIYGETRDKLQAEITYRTKDNLQVVLKERFRIREFVDL